MTKEEAKLNELAAIAAGRKRFFGMPCIHGHNDAGEREIRIASTGTRGGAACVKCTRQARHAAKRASDPNYAAECIMRRNQKSALRGRMKQERTVDLLGCSFLVAKLYLEAKFQLKWNWKNNGKLWALDHIIPMAVFRPFLRTNPDFARMASHYTNLQPLWSTDAIRDANGGTGISNATKSDTLPDNAGVLWLQLQVAALGRVLYPTPPWIDA